MRASPETAASDPAAGPRSLVIAFDGSAPPPRPRWGDRFAAAGPIDRAWISLVDADLGGFYGGVPGFGASIEAAVAALRRRAAALGANRIVTCGAGVGGHAALVYGVLLGADRIVAVEPLAHLVAESLLAFHDRRRHPDLARRPPPDLARRCDVFELMGRAGFEGEAHVLLGARRTNPHHDAVHLNAIHAEWLARSPRVILHRFDQLDPGLLDGEGEAPGVRALVLDLLAGANPPTPRSAGPPRPPTDRRPPPRPARLTIRRVEADDPANRTGRPVEFAAAGEVGPVATAAMTDDLRSWIVENLHLGAPVDDLVGVLGPLGVARREALREIGIARDHPYVRAARRPLDRLAKRDWLLATYRQLDRLRRRPFEVDRRDRLDFAEFDRRYLTTGRPALLTGLTADWPALRTWDFARLARESGHRAVVLGGATTTLGAFLDALDRPDAPPESALTVAARSANAGLWDALRRDLGPFAESARGSAWFGPRGATPPPTRPTEATLVAQVVGRARAELILLWDVAAVQDQRRPETPIAAPRPPGDPFPPLDRPELFHFDLDPGDLLFVPPGCRSRFVALDPAALVSIPVPAWAEYSGAAD